jgi:hypothetical protein
MLSHAFINLLNVFHQKNLLNVCRDCVLLCCCSFVNPIHYSFSWSSPYSVHLWFMNFHKVYDFAFFLMGTSVENWLWFPLWFWMSFIPIFVSISYSVQGAWWWPHGAIRRSNREPVWWTNDMSSISYFYFIVCDNVFLECLLGKCIYFYLCFIVIMSYIHLFTFSDVFISPKATLQLSTIFSCALYFSIISLRDSKFHMPFSLLQMFIPFSKEH